MEMKTILLAVLLASLSYAAVISVTEKESLSFKVVGQFTKQHIFLFRDVTWEIITGGGQKKTPTITKTKEKVSNKDKIRKVVYQWWENPIGEDLEDQITVIDEKQTQDNDTMICYERTYQFSKAGYLTMNIDQPSSVLYPGGFIQGKSIKTGAEPLTRLTIGAADRFPIQVSTPSGFVAGAVATAVLETIRKNLEIQKNDVWVGFAKTEDLASVFEALNFNSRVVEKIGISSLKPAKFDRMYVFMLQMLNEYYPAMLSPDESTVDDAIGVFLKESFTPAKAQEFKDLKLWGPGNIPCFVDRVFYGRFLAVSVALNKKNVDLSKKLTQGEPTADETAAILSQIFTDSTLIAYGKGPYTELDKAGVKSGDWYKFFGELPPIDPLKKQVIEPIVFSLKDFRDQSVKFSNAIKYRVEECELKPEKQWPWVCGCY